ncbi:hypothetical protein ACLI2M_16995, partial [Enterococcus faecalis]|uniref:hypothetical protein n=1 Tax=Enterococcus faecalis TaxID=1351 RepID=UPI003987DA31
NPYQQTSPNAPTIKANTTPKYPEQRTKAIPIKTLEIVTNNTKKNNKNITTNNNKKNKINKKIMVKHKKKTEEHTY